MRKEPVRKEEDDPFSLPKGPKRMPNLKETPRVDVEREPFDVFNWDADAKITKTFQVTFTPEDLDKFMTICEAHHLRPTQMVRWLIMSKIVSVFGR